MTIYLHIDILKLFECRFVCSFQHKIFHLCMCYNFPTEVTQRYVTYVLTALGTGRLVYFLWLFSAILTVLGPYDNFHVFLLRILTYFLLLIFICWHSMD